MKFIYPAVFRRSESGGYNAFFPDLECCYAVGDTLEEAVEKLKSDFLTYLYNNNEKTMEIVNVDVQYFAEYDIDNVCHLSPAWVFTCRKESNGSARYSDFAYLMETGTLEYKNF